MARTKPVLPRLSEADKYESQRTPRAAKQPGVGGQVGRSSFGGKTPAHLHQFTGTAPGGLGKPYYPRADPARGSKRRRQLLTLPPDLLRGRKPHNRVAHEVRYYQDTVHFLIPRVNFEELVREIAYKKVTSLSRYWNYDHARFARQVFEVLQTAAEYVVVRGFSQSCRVTVVAKRKTCFPIDLQMGMELAGGEF